MKEIEQVKEMEKKSIKKIVEAVGDNFRTFGNGKESSWGNPLAAAFEDKPLMFAAGVNVREVVEFVLALTKEK